MIDPNECAIVLLVNHDGLVVDGRVQNINVRIAAEMVRKFASLLDAKADQAEWDSLIAGQP